MKTNTKIILLSALTVGVLAGLGKAAVQKVKDLKTEESE